MCKAIENAVEEGELFVGWIEIEFFLLRFERLTSKNII